MIDNIATLKSDATSKAEMRYRSPYRNKRNARNDKGRLVKLPVPSNEWPNLFEISLQ